MSPELAAALLSGAQASVVRLSGAMFSCPYLMVAIARTMRPGRWARRSLVVALTFGDDQVRLGEDSAEVW
jgi:hypothetical protein